MEGIIYLEDGQIFEGKGFGAATTKAGELIFSTAMGGYQEMLTDPALRGLIVNMTYPLIGNYGISEIDNESDSIHACGLITRDLSFRPSNRMSVMNMTEWLNAHGVPGVYGVDTRAITKKIRSEGTQKCVVSTEGISKDYAFELMGGMSASTECFNSAGVTMRLLRAGSAAEGVPGRGLKIALLDFGVKRSIVTALTDLGCDVILCPYNTTAEEIIAMDPDGLFLSSGPGDPNEVAPAIETVAKLIGRLPVMGVCFGHLVLALATGSSIYKLKCGHHGANYGVIDIETGKSAITSQGHIFAVDEKSLKGSGMVVSHLNLNDGTVEGIKHESLPIFSISFHPEGAPGSCDTKWIFGRFIETIKDVKSGNRKGGSLNE